MDHHKLVQLVYEHPALWDRNHNQFRNSDIKTQDWDKIGQLLGYSGQCCKDAFKALREKYVREKEKHLQYGHNVKKWELFDMMTFLDPHIVLRKGNSFTPTPMTRIKVDAEHFENSEYLTENVNNDLIKELITLVRDSRLIWDKRHLNHGDTRMREYLWKNIGQKLNTDANICKLRWKALREKYIRQKHRVKDGEPAKWLFMKDLSFLDNVIQFRKHRWRSDCRSMDSESNLEAPITITDSDLDDHTNDSYKEPIFAKYQNYDNTNDESSTPPQQQQPQQLLQQEQQQQQRPAKSTPDSTLIIEPKRQRTESDSDTSNVKRDYADDVQMKSPEQIFGEFVAAILATKTAGEKNRIMMKIMSVLTDSTN